MTHFIYSEIIKDINERKIKMKQMHRDEALEAFKIWQNKKIKLNIKWKFSLTHLSGQRQF